MMFISSIISLSRVLISFVYIFYIFPEITNKKNFNYLHRLTVHLQFQKSIEKIFLIKIKKSFLKQILQKKIFTN